MMRNPTPFLLLIIGQRLLFDGIVKEEINEDGIEGGLGVLAKDFAPEELDAPNATA